MGAEPWPASFENKPRLIPHTKVVKNKPEPIPKAPALGVKAYSMMVPNAGSTFSTFNNKIMSAPSTYMIAITGIKLAVTRPIRLIPPTMTNPTTEAVASPVIHPGIRKVAFIVSATVFACTAFPVKKEHITAIAAKKTANHFHCSPRPFSM